MSYDVWISIIACLSGLWGLVVTFWAPTTLRKKLLCILPFVGLAVVGVLLVNVQSKRRERSEELNNLAQQHAQESLERSERDLGRIHDGIKTVQLLLATPNASPEARLAAANTVLGSLQSPFVDTGTSLTTNRSVIAPTFETNEKGNGYLEMTEIATGQKLTLSVGDRSPKGTCITGSLFMVSTGGTGSSLYLCEAGAWVALTSVTNSSSFTSVGTWSVVVPTIAALCSFLLMMIHRRNMLETVRPELVISEWRREKIGNEDPEQEQITFEHIKNVGRGAALHVNYSLFELRDNKPAAILATTRRPIISSDEMIEVNSSILLYWKNINADHLPVLLSIFCWDTRGARYETRYRLLIVPLRPGTGVAEEIAPGVMLGIREVVVTPVWVLRLKRYISRIPLPGFIRGSRAK